MYDFIFSQAACQLKLSILWFSRRLIGKAAHGLFRPHYIALIVMLVIVALFEGLFIIVDVLQCRYVGPLPE